MKSKPRSRRLTVQPFIIRTLISIRFHGPDSSSPRYRQTSRIYLFLALFYVGPADWYDPLDHVYVERTAKEKENKDPRGKDCAPFLFKILLHGMRKVVHRGRKIIIPITIYVPINICPRICQVSHEQDFRFPTQFIANTKLTR